LLYLSKISIGIAEEIPSEKHTQNPRENNNIFGNSLRKIERPLDQEGAAICIFVKYFYPK